jgi:hypothetical protein
VKLAFYRKNLIRRSLLSITKYYIEIKVGPIAYILRARIQYTKYNFSDMAMVARKSHPPPSLSCTRIFELGD